MLLVQILLMKIPICRVNSRNMNIEWSNWLFLHFILFLPLDFHLLFHFHSKVNWLELQSTSKLRTANQIQIANKCQWNFVVLAFFKEIDEQLAKSHFSLLEFNIVFLLVCLTRPIENSNYFLKKKKKEIIKFYDCERGKTTLFLYFTFFFWNSVSHRFCEILSLPPFLIFLMVIWSEWFDIIYST